MASDDPLVLRTYLDRYRVVIRTRVASVAVLVLAITFSLSWQVALAFAAGQAVLFALFIGATEAARTRLDQLGVGARLRWQTMVMASLISAHGVGTALYIDHIAPMLHHEAVLLIMTYVALSGLQVHVSAAGFLSAMAAPIVGFVLVTRPEQREGELVAHLFGGGLFIFAMLAVSWRQQATDRDAAVASAALERRNEELQSALRVAEEASRAKTEFLAVTSHEVRTPLNAVLTMAGVLARESRNARHRTLARSIESAGGMLLQLLNGILEFTRTEAGKATLRLAPVALPELVARVEAIWKARCEEAGVTLRCEVSGDPEALVVAADAGRIEQTLVNLISNAQKFSPAGAEILVRCVARRAGRGRAALRLEVADQGPGIRPEDKGRIFEAFEQTEAGREKGGTGLGLAICRSNVELMGGRFGHDDREEGGSVFWFELEAEPALVEAEPAPAAEPGAFGRLRVLGAEDNPANREVLKLILEPLGVDLDLAADGAEAVEAARAGYDLILMDAKMPGLDGLSAIARIRAEEAETGRRTPIVMVTANVFPEDVARYLAGGADAVVGKPIDVRQLVETMAQVTGVQTATAAPKRRRKAA